MTELLMQLMIIIGIMVLAFLVYTISLQQITQDIVREILDQKEMKRNTVEINKKDTIQMKS
ncbi:Uncharacterized protein BC141101_05810 [Bacillus toyonensis]|uniref:hypothetical protein n=1 Tax=Bacillus TaxID=1386 RepID=UPI00027BF90E|nr:MULTISPECIES: hypothetical protein [Bacillus cereus group]KAB0443048.1 hypothetical protein CH334_26915 [Lysinibacillus sp. VIA-II-2016]EJV90550.1 hypothetical protein IGI_05392 [Bacillus toyonensis]EOP46446.1 hypothetical protein IKI_05126 [Bacillus toyonensis]MBE7140163.1 hypothetical protein [Bacillus toyonensis]MBE7168461.1 hypothetical protein [Bacillus toyonensis]